MLCVGVDGGVRKMWSGQLMKGSEKPILQYHVTIVVVEWQPVAVRP
jgi:hypothetical protein